MTDYAFDPELIPWIDVLPDAPLRTYEDLLATRAQTAEFLAHKPVYEPGQPVDVRDEPAAAAGVPTGSSTASAPTS